MGNLVAIDIGGSSIKSATFEIPATLAQTTLRAVRRTPTPIANATALIDTVVDIVRSGPSVDAVGVVMPGLLDVPAGRVRISGNLQLVDAPIAEPISQALGIPVAFEHDVRAGAMAELYAGAARGLSDAVFLAIGTGVAAALIIDGEVRSSAGFMGEIGHAWIGTDDACICGLRGCLEAVASAAAIARRYGALTGDTCTAEQVIGRARLGDGTAQQVWRDAVRALTRVCAMLTNVIGPEAIVVGGGLSRAGEFLLAPLRAGLAASVSYQRVPEVRTATHGDDAGCLGAAIATLRQRGLA